jgi:hypothetical protein
MLMVSSNGVTWSARQKTDLCFKLKATSLETSGSLVFKEYTGSYFNIFNYQCSDMQEASSNLVYYYSTNSGTTWHIFEPNQDIDLNGKFSKIRLKVNFSGDSLSTPTLFTNGTLFLKRYKEVGNYFTTYFSDFVDYLLEYDTVKVVVEERLFANTSIAYYGSRDDKLWFRINTTDPDNDLLMYEGVHRKTWELDLRVFQELILDDSTGVQIGDTITGNVEGSGIVEDIYYAENKVLVRTTEKFVTSASLTAPSTANILNIDTYGDALNPETSFIGKIQLMSTDQVYSPNVFNVRYILKVNSDL